MKEIFDTQESISKIIDFMIKNKMPKEEICNKCDILSFQFEKIMGQDFDLQSILALKTILNFINNYNKIR